MGNHNLLGSQSPQSRRALCSVLTCHTVAASSSAGWGVGKPHNSLCNNFPVKSQEGEVVPQYIITDARDAATNSAQLRGIDLYASLAGEHKRAAVIARTSSFSLGSYALGRTKLNPGFNKFPRIACNNEGGWKLRTSSGTRRTENPRCPERYQWRHWAGRGRGLVGCDALFMPTKLLDASTAFIQDEE
ncbi:hypothetical protein DFH08DRAFT_802778 [Mycena albidolilacea]|uniref:Uncharacterized protein n=1 Tax=Mycena albidolilacea TaxID=1033008 RepID=A0AAD7EZ10_9AGAR|nr:hypothetical protein DFH08DRAFT_802778 [Mycena albidolilacea]